MSIVDNSFQEAKPSYFAHFVIRTSNYEAMVKWYEDFLQAQRVFSNDRATFLTYDDEHHRVAIVNRPDLIPTTPQHAGIDHVAYSMASIHDLVINYERLKALEILPYWGINHGPTTSMYYRDPDGNQIELQVDNWSEPGKTREYFQTPEFAANPIGVAFDPEEFARDFQHRAEGI